MPATKEYPPELREGAIRLVAEVVDDGGCAGPNAAKRVVESDEDA